MVQKYIDLNTIMTSSFIRKSDTKVMQSNGLILYRFPRFPNSAVVTTTLITSCPPHEALVITNSLFLGL